MLKKEYDHKLDVKKAELTKLSLFIQAGIAKLFRPRFSKTLVLNLGFRNTDLG